MHKWDLAIDNRRPQKEYDRWWNRYSPYDSKIIQQ